MAVAIEQFRPRWVSIPSAELSQMGKGSGPRLGVNAMAGASVMDRSGALRLVIGPVGYDDYISLSPGKPRLAEIFALTRLFIGNGFDIDAQVVLKKKTFRFVRWGLRPCLPGSAGTAGRGWPQQALTAAMPWSPNIRPCRREVWHEAGTSPRKTSYQGPDHLDARLWSPDHWPRPCLRLASDGQ